MRGDLIIYAPSVHTGGGFVLLRALLEARPAGTCQRVFLDERAQRRLDPGELAEVTVVSPQIAARLRAEFLLWRESRRRGATILCFHGLPPLLPFRSQVVVFVQNRLLIEHGELTAYPPRVRTRLRLERLLSRLLQGRCSRYIVQTPSMALMLRRWLRRDVPISIASFAPPPPPRDSDGLSDVRPKADFIYVASGEAHKNHRNLLEAWRLLAEAGQRPALALTLNASAFPELVGHVERFSAAHGLPIVNLGSLSMEALDQLYRGASALIFPSTSESFGLPLIEAAQRGLPILASELDYVRDVVEPAETFDPNSPVSIARAVRRFLGVAEPPVAIGTAADFLAEVLR